MNNKYKREKELKEICERIEEHMKDPKYVQALYEFIRHTTS